MSTWASSQILHIVDEADHKAFLNLTKDFSAMADLRVLVLYLNAEEFILEQGFQLVVALTNLHPVHGRRKADQPHKLDKIYIVVEGDFLLTRYQYVLTSPVPEDDLPSSLNYPTYLNWVVENRCAPRQKKRYAFQVTSTEQVLAKALLGIRGVRTVDFGGTGKIEGGFRRTLENSLSHVSEMVDCMPCSSRNAAEAGDLYTTVDLDKEGKFHSAAYNVSDDVANPYCLGEALNANHINEDLGFNLYNMETIDPMSEDLKLGWKIPLPGLNKHTQS
ncbi:hypothetical protein N0V90_002656 [Kalmusia sp. IMI 367209]|nr:hypothetical protein N0V90_002656 [Kalmusia sp. IMI 367209]